MKVASIAELEKLYKVNIPVAEEFEYYIRTLKKSREYSFIDQAINDIEHLETHYRIFGNFDSVKSYKMNALDRMVFYLKNTTAYEEFCEDKLEIISNRFDKFESVNKTNEFYPKKDLEFLSIDFSSANYNVLKTFDRQKNELFDSWRSLCKFMNIHQALVNSKSFRQYVFGNLNPKRNQTIQQVYIMILVRALKTLGFEENIICVTHDEVILKFDPTMYSDPSKHFDPESIEPGILKHMNDIQDVTLKNHYLVNLPLKFTRFEIDTITEKSKIYVKNIFDQSKQFKYKELFGVPGNQYYYYFKKYVLNEPIEKRDLFFRNDNKLAMWVMTPDYQPIDTKIIDEVLASDN